MEYQPITSSIVSFSKLVDHFKKQAQPNEPSVLADKGKTRPYGLVLLSSHDTTKTTKGDLPKVTVVDPVEADRQRAISNLTNEVDEVKKSNIEGVNRVPVKRKREVKKKQNGKTKSKKLSRKKDGKARVTSVIKRVKDIFD